MAQIDPNKEGTQLGHYYILHYYILHYYILTSINEPKGPPRNLRGNY